MRDLQLDVIAGLPRRWRRAAKIWKRSGGLAELSGDGDEIKLDRMTKTIIQSMQVNEKNNS